jgi:hypothetical protein
MKKSLLLMGLALMCSGVGIYAMIIYSTTSISGQASAFGIDTLGSINDTVRSKASDVNNTVHDQTGGIGPGIKGQASDVNNTVHGLINPTTPENQG